MKAVKMTFKMTPKKTLVLAVLASAAGLCAAQELGRVISATPLVSQIAVPRQVCTTSQVQVQPQRNAAGAIAGAIAGGAIGNQIGRGDGRAFATVLGFLGGAMLGDRMDGGTPAQVQNVQNCSTQNFYENRTTAYNVVYEYAGKQYSVQMPNDPGQYVQLQVTPIGALQAPAANVAGQTMNPAQPFLQGVQDGVSPQVMQPQILQAPVLVNPAQVIVAAAPQVIYAASPAYYPRAYYPPVGVSLNFGWSNGQFGPAHHRPHGEWR
jgi:uncharacterized protein YcfJ